MDKSPVLVEGLRGEEYDEYAKNPSKSRLAAREKRGMIRL
jgi:hypothetical protein